ncbi:uncharacterized protein [Mobula birostris]|uniref:uncharacterized protein n=1 Tax=Mobula birostris TaxID=1983395 RepID=UPI003B282F95
MNSGNYRPLDKCGTYPGQSIYWEKPLSPRLAPSRSIISRPMGEDPSVVQDSSNHWQTQPRCAPTGPSMSTVAKGLTMQNLGHWDWSGLEDSGKWTHHVEKVKPKAMEDFTSFGGGWNSPDHFKHQLIRQPRRLHPLRREPIHQSWAPQYLTDLSPVNQAVDCRPYREPWPGTHPPRRGAFHPSEHRQFSPLEIQPSSSESEGSKPRPAQPPTYEMYLQMKRKAEQGQKTEASPWLSQPIVQSKSAASQLTAWSERGRQPNYDLSVPNAKAASSPRNDPTRSVQFYRRQDHLSYLTGHGNSERRTQCDMYTDAERSGELRARPGYVTWHALDKYLCPAGSQHLTGANLAACHPSKRDAKGFHQDSDLKHEAFKVRSADVEVDGRAGRGERRNRMKGEVLRSKKGEVVFCLISRPDTGSPVVDSGAECAHARPENARDALVPSKSSDPRQTLLAKDERKSDERWGEIQGCKPSNREAMWCVNSTGFSINQFPSDGTRCRNTYSDIENYWSRGRLDFSDSDHSWKKEELGGRVRQRPCYNGGEDVTGFRNSDHRARGLDLHKANNSSQVQTDGQRGKREAGFRAWSYHCGRGEMEEIAFGPSDGSLGNSIDKDRKLSDFEWYGHGKSPSSRRRCWDVPLASGGRQLDGNRRREDGNNARNWHRVRKLPNWKEPSAGAEGRGKSACANRTPESDRVFIIDATCAIVRAEYISSPKKERVIFSYPIEVVGSSEARARPDAWSQRWREAMQDSVECPTPGRNPWHTEAEGYCGERPAECNGINPEKEQNPYPRARVRERMNGKATRILGLPLMDTNSAEVHLRKTGVTEAEVNRGVAEAIRTDSSCPQTDGTAEKRWGSWTGGTVVSPGKFEEITQDIRRESAEPITVHTLQSLYLACDPLSSGDTDSAAGDIQEESARRQEILEESSFVPVEHRRNTKNAENSECDEFRRLNEDPREASSQNLQDMVFESVSRIRRHTAPDSESDDEEVERLLANEVLKPEGDGGGNERGSRGSADSSSSADTVIACDVGQNLATESEEYLAPTHGVSVSCSPCFRTGNEQCVERSPREDMGGQDEGTTEKWEDGLREVESDA